MEKPEKVITVVPKKKKKQVIDFSTVEVEEVISNLKKRGHVEK